MAILDTLMSRLGRPAGRALDPTIREIVHALLKEHGYASPAEVQALRDEVRDMRTRADGLVQRLDELVRATESARAAAPPADTRALEAEIARISARLAEAEARPAAASAPAPAPLQAAPAGVCKVPGCTGTVRSKGFCSPHYQQWRRGTLAGFVGLEGQVSIQGKSMRVSADLAGGAVEMRDGKVFVDGKAV